MSATPGRLSKLIPKSLFSRMILMIIVSVVIAQTTVSVIWVTQFESRDNATLKDAARSLALSAASTVKFFRSLPVDYRHIVLDQLRNMGGTRFFVSINQEEIRINPTPETYRKRLVIGEIQATLRSRLGGQMTIKTDFSAPEDLHVFNNDILLSDLPPSWAQYSLTLEPYNPPILVTQIDLGAGEWLYLAALLPGPLTTLESDYLPTQQLVFLLIVSAFLLLFTYLAFRLLSEPLKRFAAAAHALGQDIHRAPMEESGPQEIATAAKALNAMQRQLQRYIEDREQLFSAISHDLKTPITRMRLRTELLEEDEHREKLLNNMDELEMMVKGALQAVKDTDIHENIEPVDIRQLLANIRDEMPERGKMEISGEIRFPFRGKPLAMKRCFTNLIDNGIKYGERVKVTIIDYEQSLYVYIRDFGPGVPLMQQKRIFKPYVRLNTVNPYSGGHGLGLGIARNIIHAHGGELELSNHPEGGLMVKVQLPRG